MDFRIEPNRLKQGSLPRRIQLESHIMVSQASSAADATALVYRLLFAEHLAAVTPGP